jgi:hypothetical protein
MAQVQISIGGQIAIIPGVYVQTQVTPSVPSGFLPTGPLVFLAAGQGGVPFTPYNYTDANSLIAAMRGASSQDYVNFMFNPSSELNGTSLVTYINVAPNTQSSATMQASGAQGVITLTSVNYGTPSNLINYSVAAGSVAGISMTLIDGFTGATASQDNLGVPFQLAYTGTSNSVSYSITSAVAGKATSFAITSGNAGESITLDLTTSTFGTMSAVIQALNGTGFYTCSVITGNGLENSYYLDVATSVSLPKPIATVNQYVNVTATLGDIVYFVNNNPVANTIATAKIAGSLTSVPGFIPVAVTNQYFSGATNVVPSLSNYASGLNVALNVPAWVVMTDKNNTALPGILALGSQHAALASTVLQGNWRRFLCGSAVNESAVTASSNARSQNEISTTYCWPGIIATNPLTGLTQTFDGNHVAAAVAGMMTGNPVPVPVTDVTLIGIGVEQITSIATMSQLQDNGVLVLASPSNTRLPTFLSDVTTWQNDNTAANVFNQQVSCRFALSYYITRQLAPYVGGIASNFTLAAAANSVKALLNSLIYNGNNAAGILNSWDPSTLVLQYNGPTQTLYVNVAVTFVGQNIFIVVTVTVNPLNITINSQGTVTNG